MGILNIASWGLWLLIGAMGQRALRERLFPHLPKWAGLAVMWQSSRPGLRCRHPSVADLLGTLIAIPMIASGLDCAAAEVLHPPFPGVEVLENFPPFQGPVKASG